MNLIKPIPLTIQQFKQLESDYRHHCAPIIEQMVQIDTRFVRPMYLTDKGLEYGPWPPLRDELIKPFQDMLDELKRVYMERANQGIDSLESNV